MNKRMYQQKRDFRKPVFATLRILLLAGLLAIVGMIGYYAATEGWQAVFAWFKGKWFCMVGVIVLFAATVAMWIAHFLKQARKLGEENE